MATVRKTKTKTTRNETKNPKKKKQSFFKKMVAFFKDPRVHKTFGLFLCLFSLFLFVSFISYFSTWKADESIVDKAKWYNILFSDEPVNNWMGRLGAYFAHIFLKKWFGIASFGILFLFFINGLKLFINVSLLPLLKTFKHTLFWIIWLSTTLAFLNIQDFLGGAFGIHTSLMFVKMMGKLGLAILLFFSLAAFLFFSYDLSFLKKISFKRKQADKELETEEPEEPKQKNRVKKTDTDETPTTIELEIENTENDNSIVTDEDEEEDDDKDEDDNVTDEPTKEIETDDIEFSIEETKNEQQLIHDDDNGDDEIVHIPISEPYNPTSTLPDFVFPSVELLDDYGNTKASVQSDELTQNKNKIVETLKNYSIQIVKILATIGPTVTLYEIIPAPGVRISRIKNLEDDIALSLSALGIRIIAPIPGKGTIGIEVPNQNPEIVSMKSIISSDRFQNNKFDLPIGLGKTISNESFVADLTKMPHLLMAGATGQGKSVGLNAVLTSLLYQKHPAQVKFVLVDPKKVELSLFSKIERHYLAKLPDSEEAIITDTRKVVCTLNSLCIEMDQRYDLLKLAQVRNIKEYNAKFIARKLNPENGHKFLPYIVLIVDEFADLIMTAGKEIEGPIARLAQLARAIGIHLIIATQRPSVNIITGTIKANFPARLAFRVTSKIDSRTILDSGGADQLIGRGDMLLSTGNEVIRLQCAFIDIHEVEKITDFIGSQRGFIDTFHLPEYVDELSEGNGPKETGETDPMFEDAARLIVSHQQGSTSLIQRKLKLGYNRAGRIIDQLEAAGIVGPFDGSRAREVKIKDMMHLEQYLKDLSNN